MSRVLPICPGRGSAGVSDTLGLLGAPVFGRVYEYGKEVYAAAPPEIDLNVRTQNSGGRKDKRESWIWDFP